MKNTKSADLSLSVTVSKITARTNTQKRYLQEIKRNTITYGTGPAGTGKTHLAVYSAIRSLAYDDVEKIILCRPALEAGERIGFLPGTIKEKMEPYMIPFYDSLDKIVGKIDRIKLMEIGKIEIAPVAFMRGRTFEDCFVVVDEAQNMTASQMKMLLTRIGEGSRMVVCGDPTQTDMVDGSMSGLVHSMNVLAGQPDICFVEFSTEDVVRHPVVARIIDAYEYDTRKSTNVA